MYRREKHYTIFVDEMKDGFLPRHKKLLNAWRELVLERHGGNFKGRITDTDIYARAYPDQSQATVKKHACKCVSELRKLMDLQDYQILYSATVADFFERYDMNCNTANDNARNTATRDFSQFVLSVAGPELQETDNELTLTITDEAAE